MGGSKHNDDMYASKLADAKSTGRDFFGHTAAISSGRTARKVHEKLDVKIANKSGQFIREAVDSDVHPDSVAVAVIFDETGSMQDKPRLFAEKLGKFMNTLVKKGILEHPHVLFGGVGDAYSDAVPLQIGQFEGGNEMDDALTNIFLEGNGGGQSKESYDLALYYMARHTKLDCLDKRGKKGYLFIIGDEGLYPFVRKDQVKEHVGDDIEQDIPLVEIVAECSQKFNIFWIRPSGTQHYGDTDIIKQVQALFPERVIDMEQPEDVCEVMAATIGLLEGKDLDEVTDVLKDLGADAALISRTTGAVAKYAGTGVTKAKVEGDLVGATVDAVGRV